MEIVLHLYLSISQCFNCASFSTVLLSSPLLSKRELYLNTQIREFSYKFEFEFEFKFEFEIKYKSGS